MQRLKPDSEGFHQFGVFLTFEFLMKEFFGADCDQTPMENYWICEFFAGSRFLLLQTVDIVRSWHRMFLKRITEINCPLWIVSAYPFLYRQICFDSNTNGFVAWNLRWCETSQPWKSSAGKQRVAPMSAHSVSRELSCAIFSVCFL